MIKRMVIMLLLVGLVFGGIFGFQAFKGIMIKKFMANRSAPPQTVSTIVAKEQAWQPEIEAVGSLIAVNGTDVSPEVPGLVSRIGFQSGQEVPAGTVLLQLDAKVDLARLQVLKSQAELADKTFQRDKHLLGIHAISQQEMDTASANLDSTRAQVAEQQAVIEKKTIRAPFAGRLGIRAVNLGQYLNPGSKIVTLQALDPIFLDFYLPQKLVHDVAVGQSLEVRTDALPELRFSGKIAAIDPTIDAATRNIKLRSEIANPKHQLLPGMFVTAILRLGATESRVTLPQTAVSYNPYGNIVFLVEEQAPGADGKAQRVAQQKFVTTGDTRGDQVAIVAGVKPGDVVVTSGQLKLHNGSPVISNNSIEPANNPAPTPKDQ